MARQPASTTTPNSRKPAARRSTAKSGPKPPKKAAVQAAAKPTAPRVTLPGVGAASTRLRTVLLNFAFLAAFLVLMPVIVSQFWRNEVLIDKIPVPEALGNLGLTPDVAASRLWDGLRDATAQAGTSKESLVAIPNSKRVQFSLPESGFSMESLIQQTRQFFNAYQTRITGEFTCSDPVCEPAGIKLRLRVLRNRTDVIDLPPLGETPLRDYFTNAAIQVLSVLDPFVAIAAISEHQSVRATVLARNLIRQHHPDAKWAHNLIGIMKRVAGEQDAAIAEFGAALALDPDFFIARRNLAARLVETGDLDGARREYEIMERVRPGDVEVLAGEAELAFAEKRPADAEALLLQAAALDPKDPFYLSRIGDIAVSTGDREKAETFLKKALQLDPSYVPALAALGQLYIDANDLGAAEPVYADYAEYAPEDAEAQSIYGQMLRLSGDAEGALAQFDKSLAIQPNNVELLELAARALKEQGRLPEARERLQQALAIDPSRAPTYAELASIQMFEGKLEDSLATWERVRQLQPEEVRYVAATGELLYYLQRYPEALKRFEEAEAMNPDRPETLSFKGAVLKAMGRPQEALVPLKRFLELTDGNLIYGALREIAKQDVAAIEAAATEAAKP